jgi:hypothetical protein
VTAFRASFEHCAALARHSWGLPGMFPSRVIDSY